MPCASCQTDQSREAAIRPLHDVAIVEAYAADAPLGLRLAGGLAARIAADLGARVVKIETGGGDPLRGIPPFIGDTSTTAAFLDAGKRIVPDHDGAFADADVVILDEALRRRSTELPPVVAVLSLFKPEARHGPASSFTVEALGGLLDMVGDPGREPLRLAGNQAAYAAGLSAFAGIAAALCKPKVAGRAAAETVHVSMLDTVVWLNWKSAPFVAPAPLLSRAGAAAEWQVIRCADGWVALVYQDADWAGLCDMVDDARLRAPCFAGRAERLRRIQEVTQIIAERFLLRRREALHAEALKRRLPIGPVWSVEELVADPQNVARGLFAPVGAAGCAAAAMPQLPVVWGGMRFPAGALAPHDVMVAHR
ncbi:CoA transferase [Bosea sp. (in: a-proteobacteria)]|uniref:CoA transferase n=1 Tax=Bosea sp. (in: a-proteobacteria) TaxID=1871050 RepID=UPI002609CA40|nr:CoA transferase [Bosea sp. (in: a-proteobacteria)]MCO5090225.1 CoA transferase [Bosea sp. (in: a-proteobacteria)]